VDVTAKEFAERVEKQIPRRTEVLLVMTKIKGLATAQLKLRPFKSFRHG